MGYSYGPIKNSYFTTFEKIWIEGYCKDNNLSIDDNTILPLLIKLSESASEPIKAKSIKLLADCKNFTDYVGTMFDKSWNNIVGFSMKVVKPSQLTESQVNGMMVTSKWWLKEAPKKLSEELKLSYAAAFVYDQLTNDNFQDSVMQFSPARKNAISEKAKSIFNFSCVPMPHPPCRINPKDILMNEAAMRLFPSPEKVVAMAFWTAECVASLNKYGNERK